MLRLQRTYAALPLALALYGCKSDDAGAMRHPRLVVRHPASSGDESPPRMVAPPEPPSPEQLRLQQLRQQTRPHVAVALGGAGYLASALPVPLPTISLDVGAQIRDVFSVFAMTRFASLYVLNALTFGPAFEWALLDVLSLGVGATAMVTHWHRSIGYWGVLMGFPIMLNVDIPTTSRPAVARDSFRIAIEVTTVIDTSYQPRAQLLLGVGLGYARR